MTFPPTFYFIFMTLIVWIAFDIWLVEKHGSKATESWTVTTLWLAHPVLMSPAFVLISHFFWPKCGHAGDQSISPRHGVILGVAALLVLAWEMLHRRWMLGEAKRLGTSTITGAPLKMTLGSALRLAAIAFLGIVIGHYLAGQYVECGS